MYNNNSVKFDMFHLIYFTNNMLCFETHIHILYIVY